MEIKSILKYPYTEDERINFIVTQNHQLGYEIRYVEREIEEEIVKDEETQEIEVKKETVIDLQAWGYTDEEIEEQKKAKISNLTCTKRVFALMLQELGIDYATKLKPLIEDEPNAQLEWDLCVELVRSNPLIDKMGAKLKVTPTQIDLLFMYANDIITIEEFRKKAKK